jgi:hypothetical protein
MPPIRNISFSIEDATVSREIGQEEHIKLVDTLLQHQPFQEREHQLLQELTSVGTCTPTAAVAEYVECDACKDKNSERNVECFFSIHYIEAKLIQEAAERRQQAKKNEEVAVVAVTVDAESSSSNSSYWDMPPTDEHALLVSFLLSKNNQPQQKQSCHHHRPLTHHAAPTDMNVHAYWNDSDNNNQAGDEDDDIYYWNDPSHSHYNRVKKSVARSIRRRRW